MKEETCSFSSTAQPYICYCDHVTEADIVAALEAGASTVQEIAARTGAMQHCNCATMNPNGVCCHAAIAAVLAAHQTG